MQCTIPFDYSIDEIVTVKALKEEAVVKALGYDGFDTTYQVVYWCDGNRYIETVFSWEIEPID